MRVSGYLGYAVVIIAAIGVAPAFGQDGVEEASRPPLVTVCPDGGYESGCTITEMERAITLTPDALMLAAKQCLYATKARCWVNASGTISSMERGGPVLWQHLLLSPKDGPASEMIILAELNGKPVPTLVAAQQTEGYFSPPNVVQNSDDGVLIHVPGITGGTGGGNADILAMRTKQGWNDVNMELWFDDVNVMLPTGFEIRKGVDLNLREMTGYSPVWRENDGNCCGTGGTVIIDFAITTDNRLTVTQLAFDETQPVGRTQYIFLATLNP